ncbi:hypothetical protein Btru_018190 [Bulinus truncatus]|nr:hypothetical protein Btru_018190 [Bulinus truncatus]
MVSMIDCQLIVNLIDCQLIDCELIVSLIAVSLIDWELIVNLITVSLTDCELIVSLTDCELIVTLITVSMIDCELIVNLRDCQLIDWELIVNLITVSWGSFSETLIYDVPGASIAINTKQWLQFNYPSSCCGFTTQAVAAALLPKQLLRSGNMSLLDTMTTTVSSFVDKFVYVIDKENQSRAAGGYVDGHVPYFTSSPELSESTVTTPESFAAEDDMTPEQLRAVTVMLISFSIFGCLGNGLVLYVFSKKSDKVSSTIFILALAWTDFFVCLIFMPFTATYLNLKYRVYYEVFCKSFNFINTSNVPLSAFLMVAIAVDR